MQKITLKPFQVNAVGKLKGDLLHKWDRDTRQGIRFQAPTGSGKTVMMAQFIKEIVSGPELLNSDFAFLWASIGGSKEGDLASQSRNKFNEYYGTGSGMNVSSLDDLDREKLLERGEILFFNWSKIRVRNKEGRKLRREGEKEISWDGMVRRTQAQDRKILLIIDEAHTQSMTSLTEEEIKLIAPKMVIKITATHREQSHIDIHIPHRLVTAAGLIKEAVESQTKEDFVDKKIKDLDIHILKLALKKREGLAELYEKKGLDINPLLMIQLPNDDRALQAEDTKKDIVLTQLKALKIKEASIAVWLDKEKINLDNITKNNNKADVLLFKQAPATGWDCPRAQVLLMYRETKDPVFQIQVLGRVLRMPEGKHYENSVLNRSYLYTTYTKNDILNRYEDFKDDASPALFHALIRDGIEQCRVETCIPLRRGYRDLGKNFQSGFIKVANDAFNKNKLLQSQFDFGDVNIALIVDQKFGDYDRFIEEIEEATSLGQKMSPNDVEKLYKKLCIERLRGQEKDMNFDNISRSYNKLKAAINVWFEDYLKIKDKEKYYPCVVNDLGKGANSVLLPVINEALSRYGLSRKKEEDEKERRTTRTKEISIPPGSMSYSGFYRKEARGKCAMSPCYVRKDNKNERAFIDFLEVNPSVEWWYKNGDHGAEHFAIKRSGGNLFYPDWFVQTKNTLWIIDTKEGWTAEGEEAAARAQALADWLKKHKEFKGGLAKREAGLWKLAVGGDIKEWINLQL